MSEWISVNERLPDVGVQVLTFDIQGETYIREIIQCQNSPNPWSGPAHNMHKWTEWSDCYCQEDLTHWMPIPEPPSE